MYQQEYVETLGSMKVLICVAVAIFVALAQSTVAQGANITLPLTYPGQVLQDGSQTCPSEEQVERVRNKVDNATLSLLQETVVPLLQTQLPTRPPAEQNFSCGGSTGWRRVAYLNMSDPSQQCPSLWREITTPHRVCGRRSPTRSCEGVNYTTGGEQYSQVCGRIIGYQIGSPEALYFASIGNSINTYYVDGISVTRGSPRQHVWTFACGIDEVHTGGSCPCVAGSSQAHQNYIPLFIGRNYFCESGKTSGFTDGLFYPDGDPLWDGQGCGPTSSCCTFNSPPWFNVRLSFPTTDDIEVRICCGHGGISIEDVPIQLIELYVK